MNYVVNIFFIKCYATKESAKIRKPLKIKGEMNVALLSSGELSYRGYIYLIVIDRLCQYAWRGFPREICP